MLDDIVRTAWRHAEASRNVLPNPEQLLTQSYGACLHTLLRKETDMNKELREWLKLQKEFVRFQWSPKVVFIRYFVVLPLLILIIYLVIRK